MARTKSTLYTPGRGNTTSQPLATQHTFWANTVANTTKHRPNTNQRSVIQPITQPHDRRDKTLSHRKQAAANRPQNLDKETKRHHKGISTRYGKTRPAAPPGAPKYAHKDTHGQAG